MKKSKILIPVLGISSLAAAVAPVMTITSCNKGVTVNDTDKEFLEEINSYLSYKADLISPHKAITALKDLGCDVLSFKLSSSSLEFAFDSAVKRFIIMNGDNVVAKPEGYEITDTNTVFKFTKTYDANSKYGQYLLDDFEWSDPTALFQIKGSIDVGNNTNIKNMYYDSESTTSKTVLLRTYCEVLNVFGGSDKIYHMGAANNTNVSSTNKAKYIELGKVAYMHAQNIILSVNAIDKADSAEIDVLETASDASVIKGVTFDKDLVGTLIGQKIQDVAITPTTVTEVTDEATLTTAITTDKKPFIRLKNDITLSTAALSIKDITTIIDLASFNIIDNVATATVAAGSPVITVGPCATTLTTTALTLINSNRSSGAIKLGDDHSIQIAGDEANSKVSILYLEGANITHRAVNKRAGAIQVGTKEETSASSQYSRLYMFGGRITSQTEKTGHDVQACGVQVLQDAYFQMVYGSIISDTICVRTNGQYEGGYIELVNATLVNSRTTEGMCVYMANGTLKITGGLYIGHCCLGVRGGNTDISGGYFHAYGEDQTDISEVATGTSGVITDGSVICVQLSAKSSSTVYGVNPCITLHNATLQSDNSYILQMYRAKDAAVDQYYEADFWDGVYYYGKKTTGDYSGIRIDSNVSSKARINQYRGSWICTEEE